MRYSKQRQEVLNVVMASNDHPDAKMVYERVKEVIPKISLGTVYRNLNDLVNLNEIKRISIKDGNDRFDKTICNHNHVYCIICGKVMDVNYTISNENLKKIEKQTGFKITNSNFNIKGICNNCRKER